MWLLRQDIFLPLDRGLMGVTPLIFVKIISARIDPGQVKQKIILRNIRGLTSIRPRSGERKISCFNSHLIYSVNNFDKFFLTC